MGRNGEPGAVGLAAARGGVELGVGARFARLGTAGTSNVASEPLRDRRGREGANNWICGELAPGFGRRAGGANAIHHGSSD